MIESEKKKAMNRLKRISGQVNGLQKMLDEDVYCIDIVNQTSSVRSALRGFENSLLEDHLSTCVVNQIKSGQEKKAVAEIIKVYKLKK